MFEVKSSDQPYAGAGLGIHFISSRSEVPDMVIGGNTMQLHGTLTRRTSSASYRRRLRAPNQPEADFVSDAWFSIVDSLNMLSAQGGWRSEAVADPSSRAAAAPRGGHPGSAGEGRTTRARCRGTRTRGWVGASALPDLLSWAPGAERGSSMQDLTTDPSHATAERPPASCW